MEEVKFVEQGYEILGWYGDDGMLFEEEPVNFIASVARTCYRSEPKGEGMHSPYSDVRIDAERDANERLVRSLIRNGHHAMLEFGWLAVKVTTDRAVAAEITRHRLFSFAQESSRYVNFSKSGYEFIMPPGLDEESQAVVRHACMADVARYEMLLKAGSKPEIARSVLPLCLATKLCMAANLREWRHLFRLRTARDAHPQIRELFTLLLRELQHDIPLIFEGIEPWEE